MHGCDLNPSTAVIPQIPLTSMFHLMEGFNVAR